MTDRYILTKPLRIAHRFRTIQSVTGEANYNIRREMKVPTISRNAAGKNEVVNRMLGFVPAGASAHEPTYFTVARSETVHERPLFRNAFLGNRCLAVADGCYVWDGKQPYLLRLKSGELFGIAAIASTNANFKPPLHSFCILTTYPNALVAQVHHRMPVILSPQDEARYLNPATSLEELRQLLLPYPEAEMLLYPVSPKLRRATSNSKAFIQPVTVQSLPVSGEDEEEMEQLPLLD